MGIYVETIMAKLSPTWHIILYSVVELNMHKHCFEKKNIIA